jgi:hypothetical protein
MDDIEILPDLGKSLMYDLLHAALSDTRLMRVGLTHCTN